MRATQPGSVSSVRCAWGCTRSASRPDMMDFGASVHHHHRRVGLDGGGRKGASGTSRRGRADRDEGRYMRRHSRGATSRLRPRHDRLPFALAERCDESSDCSRRATGAVFMALGIIVDERKNAPQRAWSTSRFRIFGRGASAVEGRAGQVARPPQRLLQLSAGTTTSQKSSVRPVDPLTCSKEISVSSEGSLGVPP